MTTNTGNHSSILQFVSSILSIIVTHIRLDICVSCLCDTQMLNGINALMFVLNIPGHTNQEVNMEIAKKVRSYTVL